MSITPLCKELAALAMSARQMSPTQQIKKSRRRQYQSPDVFASALRPICPQRSQRLAIRARAMPETCTQDVVSLKVRPFKYAPKSRTTGLVAFKDIPQTSKIVKQRQSTNKNDRPQRQVKRRSLPFNEHQDLDPWLLFPNLQRPNSALKSDSLEYIKQAQEAEAAKEMRYRARLGSPLSADELKDLCHLTFNMGKYATPPARMPPTPPESIYRSPMDID